LDSRDERFNNTFKNVIIWEEVKESKLNKEIELILNQKFNIPQSRCSDIRQNLCELVLKGRDTENNIIPSLKQIIQQNKPGRPQFNEGQYLSRKNEDHFIQKLSKGNILLLTGSSFRGKTELAKNIWHV
jgi:hypothetical protein